MKNPGTQQLEHIIRRMQTDMSVDAPVDAIRYAKNLYRTRASHPASSVIRRVLAVLRADLAPGRAAFGERSGRAGQARQMLFESGETAVDLRITSSEKAFDVRGQVLGTGFENGVAEMTAGQNRFTARIDEMSQFDLSALPAGEYSLTLRGAGVELVIEQLTLT